MCQEDLQFFSRKYIKETRTPTIKGKQSMCTFDTTTLNLNGYFGVHKQMALFFFQILQRWNKFVQQGSLQTNWRVIFNLHQFIFRHMRGIEQQQQNVRNQNIEKLYNWYLREVPHKECKQFNFIKLKTQNSRIKEEMDIRSSFVCDQTIEIKKYKRRLFVENEESLHQLQSLSVSKINKAQDVQLTIEKLRLDKENQRLKQNHQSQEIVDMIQQTKTQKQKLKNRRLNSQLFFPSNNFNLQSSNEPFMKTYRKETVELKQRDLNTKHQRLKLPRTNLSIFGLHKPNAENLIFQKGLVDGMLLMQDPFEITNRHKNKKKA